MLLVVAPFLAAMSCGPGADQFIEEHFKDCVYKWVACRCQELCPCPPDIADNTLLSTPWPPWLTTPCCQHSVRDYIGFCLGLAAIAFWIIAQVRWQSCSPRKCQLVALGTLTRHPLLLHRTAAAVLPQLQD